MNRSKIAVVAASIAAACFVGSAIFATPASEPSDRSMAWSFTDGSQCTQLVVFQTPDDELEEDSNPDETKKPSCSPLIEPVPSMPHDDKGRGKRSDKGVVFDDEDDSKGHNDDHS